MNTLRACAVFGLGLSLAFAYGCSSDSTPNAKRDGSAGGGRGGGGGGGNGGSNPATTNTPCTNNGTTYQPGQYFTNNCVKWTCVSGTTFTSTGSPCSDAGPITPTDTRVNQDLPVVPDAGRDVSVPDVSAPVDQGGKDVSPTEAGKRDTVVPLDTVPLDTGAPDLVIPKDTASPTPDLPIVVADVAVIINLDAPPVVQCSYHGQKYPVGDFACDCNTCTCEIGGTITPVTTNDCTIDAL